MRIVPRTPVFKKTRNRIPWKQRSHVTKVTRLSGQIGLSPKKQNKKHSIVKTTQQFHTVYFTILTIIHMWKKMPESKINCLMVSEDGEEVLTIWDTLILDLEILVCPRTRIWKDIWPSDNDTLCPVVTSEKQSSRRVNIYPFCFS